MRVKLVNYKADNNPVTGFGGLLMTPLLARVMQRFARQIQLAIAAQAFASEPEAVAHDIEPGHVSSTFSNTRRRGYVESYVGWPGVVRRGVMIEATGRYEPGDRDEEGRAFNLKSDPIVLEAGSGYKEGARGARPALQVMLRGARKWSAVTRGTEVQKGRPLKMVASERKARGATKKSQKRKRTR